MKKQFLLLSLLVAFVANVANAQDTTIAVFDDGVLDWGTWGAPLSIIANPSMVHNNTDSCALLDQTGGAWSGMSLADWSGTPILGSSVVGVSVDVYFANTGGQLKLHADNSLSGQDNIEMYVDVDPDVWTQVIFDISDLETVDYQQVAFQSSVADSLLVDNVRFLAPVPEDATNLLAGGGMENEAAWNFYFGAQANDNIGTHTFNYIADTAKYGEGGGYYVSGENRTATMLWQPVTLKSNRLYQLSGAFKDVSEDSIANVWLEWFLTSLMPDGNEIVFDASVYGYGDNTWNGPERLVWVDTTFQDYISPTGIADGVFSPWIDGEAEWYAVIKAGEWTDPGSAYEPTFELLIDNLMLQEVGDNPTLVVDQVLDGEVTDAADYTCTADVTWDADSVYIMLNVVDDTIYIGDANAYVNDNIEIYFDMDNSKIVTIPRGTAPWPMLYDDNDYQLRVVPEATWEANNTLGGVNYAYEVTADGYSFMVNICWDSLLVDFDASVGTVIGFDIDASDNDGSYRNQITWNSPSLNLWSDQSFWGTMELDEDGLLLPILDTEAPAAPVVAATPDNETGEVEVTWDAVTDNITVLEYQIKIDGSTVATQFGQVATGTESYTSDSLENGTHTIIVVAVDNYGNTAASAGVDVEVAVEGGGGEAIENLTEQNFSVYPNPSEGMVTISSNSEALTTLHVYTMSGELVAVHTFNSSFNLDMTNVNPGMYILQLETEGTVEVQRIIIE